MINLISAFFHSLDECSYLFVGALTILVPMAIIVFAIYTVKEFIKNVFYH